MFAALSGLCTCQARTYVRCNVEHSGCQRLIHMAQLPHLGTVVHQFSAMSAQLVVEPWPPWLLQGGPRGEPTVEQRCRLSMICTRLASAAVHCLHADVVASPVVRLPSLSLGRLHLADALH